MLARRGCAFRRGSCRCPLGPWGRWAAEVDLEGSEGAEEASGTFEGAGGSEVAFGGSAGGSGGSGDFDGSGGFEGSVVEECAGREMVSLGDLLGVYRVKDGGTADCRKLGVGREMVGFEGREGGPRQRWLRKGSWETSWRGMRKADLVSLLVLRERRQVDGMCLEHEIATVDFAVDGSFVAVEVCSIVPLRGLRRTLWISDLVWCLTDL